MRASVTRRRWVVAVHLGLWAAAACGDDRTPAAPLSARAVEPDVAALVRRADEAFAASQKPDYRRPFVQGPDLTKQVGSLYWKACLAGDKRSCWTADALIHSKHTEMMVRRNCLAGDRMSCRALPDDNWSSKPDKRLQGWAGRVIPCDEPECIEAQRRECAAGFPRSCEWVPIRLTGSLNNIWHYVETPFQRRMVRLALEACLVGVIEDCRWLESAPFHPREAVDAAGQHCAMKARNCPQARIGDVIKDRDLLEHGCQYGSGDEQAGSCRRAEDGYYNMGYPEPYPGRALELGRWSCARRHDPAKCLQDLQLQQARHVAP